ncbi:MAG: sulfur reduction protein DsrE [Thiobacillus sp.]|nr:sulfur reduction protein DsrE [Thiobacillus sp.]
MKVAYVFITDMAATFKLNTMILPQLEAGNHGAQVVGMMFFDDNVHTLRSGDPYGERAVRRGLAEGEFEQCGSGQVKPKGLIAEAQVGCFPQLYAALSGATDVQVISL